MHNRPPQRVGLATAALAVACAAVLALAPAATAIVPPRNCGKITVEGKRYQIKSDQLRCRRAKRYSRRYLASGDRPSGYRCTNYSARETRLKFRCAKGLRTFFAIRR